MSSLRNRVVDEVGKVVVSKERRDGTPSDIAPGEGTHPHRRRARGLEDAPGEVVFECMGLGFRRVQFTPDMLPLDIVGGFIFDMKDREFEFRKGPVFTNILLADEINRSPPKVQSALLESMQERQVTVEGHTEALPSPHMVIATQNSVEFQGVYPLPEAQLDRFMLRIRMGYPSVDRRVRHNQAEHVRDGLRGDPEGGLRRGPGAQPSRRSAVKISDELVDYMARFAAETRADERVELGASPRAMVHLTHAARAKAYLSGRSYVIPDDIKELAVYVIRTG